MFLTELAQKFAAIFAGLDRVYGWYAVPPGSKPDAHGKLYGRRATAAEPVTVALWERHLAGEDGFGIGIVPIRDDSTCVFGTIDVDVYPIDHLKIISDIERLHLPLSVGRSKSGGAHLWLFLSEPASAELVRARLSDFATALGFPRAEIFPKQSRLDDDSKGSWINIPYNGRGSVRYVFRPDGTAYDAEEFADAVPSLAIAPTDLASFRITTNGVAMNGATPPGDTMFPDGPPCLQAREKAGFGDWQNNGTFAIAVYLKKKTGKVDFNQLRDYNLRLMNPALSDAEVRTIVKSASKKSYSYKCGDEPICSVCNKAVCVTRKYGVGGDRIDPGVEFGAITKLKTEPPIFVWNVDGKPVKMSAKQILDQRLVREILFADINAVMELIPGDAWTEMLKEKMAALTEIDVPRDATPEGQVMVHLQRFCTGRVVGKALDDLLRGLPYTDEKDGLTYFCSSDFLAYLATHRVSGIDERELYTMLRPRNLQTHRKKVKGKTLDYWSVPAFEKQTEEFDRPGMPAPDRM